MSASTLSGSILLRSLQSIKSTKGWRATVLRLIGAASIILVINLILVVWGESLNGFPSLAMNDGRRVIYKGNCDITHKLSIIAHLVINIFSTILLGASNYCMQCMAAPNRKEIDDAHAGSSWLHIGSPSIRNLLKISKKRVVLWLLLAITSIPIHLFYNSAVFSSIGSYDYTVFQTTEFFIDSISTELSSPSIIKSTSTKLGENFTKTADEIAFFKLLLSPSLERLKPLDCANQYGKDYQTRSGSVILVESQVLPIDQSPFSVLAYSPRKHPSEWVCTKFRNNGGGYPNCQMVLPFIQANISDWTPTSSGSPLQYCLSEKVDQRCQLQYSIHLFIVIICTNIVKLLIFVSIAWRFRHPTLMTLGDAMASFLSRPDPFTERACLIGKREAQQWRPHQRQLNPTAFNLGVIRRPWDAASGGRIVWFLLLYFAVMGGIIYLLIGGLSPLNVGGPEKLTTFSFGEISEVTLISWHIPKDGVSGVLGSIIVVNIPQLLLSLLYIMYNGIYTSVCSETEWASFSVKRKGLRVSGQQLGQQRGTYFLQIPYRYGVPLMIMFATLHWLASQSLFLVDVQQIERSESDKKGDEWRVRNEDTMGGYSPVGVLITMIVGAVAVLALLISAFQKLKSSMPLVGNCSAVIAAACHPGSFEEGEFAAESMVQWGVIESEKGDIGHCGFSMHPVENLEGGKLYA